MKKIKLLFDFSFVVDMDMAVYKYIHKYNSSDIFMKENMNLKTDEEIIKLLINRTSLNPLELVIKPEYDSSDLYLDLMENHQKELLEYARATDAFALMVTYLKMLNDVSIKVLCENELQSKYIKKLNSNIDTLIMHKEETNPALYDSLYIKFYAEAISFPNLNGKNIYISRAKYNMDHDLDSDYVPNTHISAIVGYTNKIHLMDLYKNIKFN